MACNADFVKEFFNTVISPTERGRYVDSTGLISQQGLKRIRNAILAKAFCDTAEGFWVIERIAESMDNNVRVISSALILKAARFTELKAAIEAGHRYPLDISGELVKALRTFSDLKTKGRTVADHLNQGNMLGEAPDHLQGLLLRSLATAKDKRQHLETILENYMRLVHLFGDPHQLHLTSRPEPTKADLFQQAFDQFERDLAEQEPATPRKRKSKVGKAA